MNEKEKNDELRHQRKINKRKTKRERRLMILDRRQKAETRKKDHIERRINSEDRRLREED
jgi:hypothetical protein